MSVLMTRFFFVCGALLLMVAGAAFGDGTYQRTRDDKTMIWNDRARPGDKASWSGDRDREGYATGFGTLTWYTTERKGEGGSTKSVIDVRYWGNMVRGKFDGPVNAHSKGKTDHAIFADGKRTTRWAPGTAPSRAGAQRWAELLKEKREVAKNIQHPIPKALAQGGQGEQALNSETVHEQGPQPPNRDTPAEGPVSEEKAEDRNQTSEIGSQKSVATASQESQGSAATATPSVGEDVGSQKSEVGAQKSEIVEVTPAKKREVAATTPRPGEAVPKPWMTKKSQAKADEALRALVGPPASLRPDTVVNIPSTKAQSEAAPSGSIAARLTREEVVDAADAEARRRGYDPAEYIHGEPEFKAADGVWSVSYKQSSVNEMAETAKNFSVTIDDKTKGIVFVPGK
jgi:hypothetical protein